MKFNSTGRVDFEVIRKIVSLERLVEGDLGPPMKGGRWPCPIHGGDGPNFAVDGERWKCWSCGATGDIFDYLAKREGITLAEAATRLDPMATFRHGIPWRPTRPTPAGNDVLPTKKPKATEDPAWQAAVDGLIRKAERNLWAPQGRPALAWLRARGLDSATISTFRLGFFPGSYRSDPLDVLGLDRQGRPRYVWAGRGIVIPWFHPSDGWVGTNVRNLPEDLTGALPGDKYTAISGSERGHGYPFPGCAAPGVPALICEGEFDALIGWQEAGWVANIVTFGGAGQRKETEDGRAFLGACSDWLLMFDQDDAGDNAAREMARRAPRRCRRLYLPDGIKDLTDYHKSGGSVLDWLRTEWERFGWTWPLRS